MRKTAMFVFAFAAVATVPAVAGECSYVPFPDGSDSVSVDDGALGANAGCAVGQLLGLSGSCMQNYRDTETGEFCVPDEYSGDGEPYPGPEPYPFPEPSPYPDPYPTPDIPSECDYSLSVQLGDECGL